MQRIVTSSWLVAAAGAAFVLASTVAAPADTQAPAAGQDPVAAPEGAPQAPGARGGGRGGGGRIGGRGRGGGPTVTPSALRAVAAETTAAKVADPNWTPPRLSWGHPDLEGTWTSDDMRGVPSSRPAQFGTRESLTPEEFAQRAGADEASRDRAVNQETFLRNEFGVRTFGYTSLIVDPPSGQQPALTAAARARAEAVRGVGTFGTRPLNTFEDFSLYDRCITRGVPGSIMPVLYGNGLRIVQSPSEVTITYEMIHDTRVIPLDGRPPLGPGVKQWIGDSRGRFEGDTLVIETTNFTSRTSLGGAPHSEQLKLTEWLTRIDPEMIDYRVRIDDPDTFEAPYTMRLTITQQPGYELYEYSCHEGNTALSQGLAGERAFDKLIEDAIAKGLPPPERPARGMDVYGAPDPNLPVRDVNAGSQ